MALYIQSNQELAQHPKVLRLARTLKVSIPDAIGRLHLLWWWALTYAKDGDMGACDASDIADIVMWEDDPDALLEAFINCGGKSGHGFIDRTEDGNLFLHDWNEHCRIFADREKGKERTAKCRERRREAEEQATQNTENTPATDETAIPEDENNEDVTVTENNVTQSNGYVTVTEQNVTPLDKDKDKDKDKKTTPPTPPAKGGRGTADGYPPEFETFWAAYPRRIEKKAAYKAWLAVTRSGVSAEQLTIAATGYQRVCAMRKAEPDKIKLPTTFLHEDRWRDWSPDGAAYQEAMKHTSTWYPARMQSQRHVPTSYEEAKALYGGKRPDTVTIDAKEVA